MNPTGRQCASRPSSRLVQRQARGETLADSRNRVQRQVVLADQKVFCRQPVAGNASPLLNGTAHTPRHLEKMGALFAELHHHGAAWTPPASFTTRRFEHWLSRGEENLLAGDKAPSAAAAPQPDGVDTLPPGARELLERMHRHVELAYAAIDRSDLRVIHCDLWHDNLKLHRGALHPLDFEDTVWGFRAHDIAMAMLDLLEATDEARYADLLAAFLRGYQAHTAWPDDPIEPFQIGRLLWKINWVARYQPEWLASMVERHVPVFEQYERTGRVVRLAAG